MLLIVLSTGMAVQCSLKDSDMFSSVMNNVICYIYISFSVETDHEQDENQNVLYER